MQLSADTFKQLRDLIYERSGMYFQDNKKYILEGRLQARLRERCCRSYEDYCNLLKFDAWRDHELAALFDLITTNETFFYRDIPQLHAFSDTILPAVIEANRASSKLRIWSAACSSGDEPYTLAMMLLERPALASWSIEILGSDISEAVLNQARRGQYGPHSVRNVPPALLRKYFVQEGSHYVLSEKVKQVVKFMNLNLYDQARLKLLRGFDVVFCRNCLIYFDDKAKQKIIASLHDCLRPQGYLVIGFSESMHALTTSFKAVHAQRTVLYQKMSSA